MLTKRQKRTHWSREYLAQADSSHRHVLISLAANQVHFGNAVLNRPIALYLAVANGNQSLGDLGDRAIMRDHHNRLTVRRDEVFQQFDHAACLPSIQLPVGSSANKRAGRMARARAIATRCCSPQRVETVGDRVGGPIRLVPKLGVLVRCLAVTHAIQFQGQSYIFKG